MKMLVTGALGAVGTPLVEELRQRGHDVWLLDKSHGPDAQYLRCDIGEYHQLEQVFSENKFDVVYHLAGEFGRNNGEDFYETMWRTNAVGTKHLLRFQEKLKFRMIFTSSSEIYGDYAGVMKEDVPMKTPIRQLNDYAISKWVNEMQILNSADRFGTETVRLRLFNTYGPGEYYSNYRSVICLFVYRALHKMPYTVFTRHHRTFSWIYDTVKAMANISDNFKPGEIYNISGDEFVPMKKASDMILEQLGISDSLVKYSEVEAHNTIDKKSDNSKSKKDLGYKETVKLKEGIAKTIEWQKQVYGK
jgi:dTDP-glucose 4,6-dehydratase